MLNLIKSYYRLEYKEKLIVNLIFSMLLQALLAIGKFLLGFYNIFFIVAGFVNLFILLAKLGCFIGMNENKDNFARRNRVIAILLMTSGLTYVIYMSKFLIFNESLHVYNLLIRVCIALVSFIEMAVAIGGIFKAYGKGHYIRDIKIISLSSALTAMMFTQIALTAAESTVQINVTNGIVGIVVGIAIILLGVFAIIAPHFSLTDKTEYAFKKLDNDFSKFKEDIINIQLTNYKFYSNFYFIGEKADNFIYGKVVKGKNPFLKLNIMLKILILLLSEILIFFYLVGILINFFKHPKVIVNLNNIMSENNYQQIIISEDEKNGIKFGEIIKKLRQRN